MKTYLTIIFCFAASIALAQRYMYVNTDNLLVRTSPGKEYDVRCILQAGCRVRIEAYCNNETQSQRAKFYFVALVTHHDDIIYVQLGYIERRYLVSTRDSITARVTTHANDTDIDAYRTMVPVNDSDKLYVDHHIYNSSRYRYPKYKGGEHFFATPKKREYHLGPHNGCYYLDGNGRKKYVDRKYCK